MSETFRINEMEGADSPNVLGETGLEFVTFGGEAELTTSSAQFIVNRTLHYVMYSVADTNWTLEHGNISDRFPGADDITSSSSPSRRKTSMAWWQQLAWTTVFALMLFVAIGGNAIVMWIVLAHRRMRTVTNYFLVNLSFADLMMAVLNCIFNFIYMLSREWHFGSTYCTINNFVANVTVAASVFTLTGISFDRYLAIVRPLKPRMSKISAQLTILVIWVASMALAFPCLLYSTTRVSHGTTACFMEWPDGTFFTSKLDYAYNLVLFFVTYLIPICSMAACYSSMGKELWGSRSIGELTQRQQESIKSKRKVVRMFIVVVSIFAICWLPYHGYFIYSHYDNSVAYTKYIQHLYLFFYWLAMSNSMVNPLIYYWMNARFRQYFRNVVCEWHCDRKRSNPEGGETPPMFRRYSQSYSKSRSGTHDDYPPGARAGATCDCGLGHRQVLYCARGGAAHMNGGPSPKFHPSRSNPCCMARRTCDNYMHWHRNHYVFHAEDACNDSKHMISKV